MILIIPAPAGTSVLVSVLGILTWVLVSVMDIPIIITTILFTTVDIMTGIILITDMDIPTTVMDIHTTITDIHTTVTDILPTGMDTTMDITTDITTITSRYTTVPAGLLNRSVHRPLRDMPAVQILHLI